MLEASYIVTFVLTFNAAALIEIVECCLKKQSVLFLAATSDTII